jgi:hypothetical protein
MGCGSPVDTRKEPPPASGEPIGHLRGRSSWHRPWGGRSPPARSDPSTYWPRLVRGSAVLGIASSEAGTKRTRSCRPTALPSPRQAGGFSFLPWPARITELLKLENKPHSLLASNCDMQVCEQVPPLKRLKVAPPPLPNATSCKKCPKIAAPKNYGFCLDHRSATGAETCKSCSRPAAPKNYGFCEVHRAKQARAPNGRCVLVDS